VEKFNIKGNALSAKDFGSGHINDTYRVNTDSSQDPDYLLQRINHHVFKEVDTLMNNIQIVTDHLKSKVKAIDSTKEKKEVLSLVRTKDEKLYYHDSEGNYWRVLVLIDNMKSYDIVETESQAREGGRAFGEFQSQLSDLDSNK